MTPISLLERLRKPNNQEAWREFVALFTPLLCEWAGRLGLRDADAADLVQDVLVILVTELPTFQYDSRRSFRGWLRTVMHNRWCDQQRREGKVVVVGAGLLPHLPGPNPIDSFTEAEYSQYLAVRALRLMKAEFEENTWKACWERVVEGRPAGEVAAELDMTVNAVHVATSRVLARLRERMAGLFD
jgi:RNA polymerase sigma-70 factor (ECF subfamily)